MIEILSDEPFLLISIRHAAVILAFEQDGWRGKMYTEEEQAPFSQDETSARSEYSWASLELSGLMKIARDDIEAALCKSADAGRLKLRQERRDASGALSSTESFIGQSELIEWSVIHRLDTGDWFESYWETEERICSEALAALEEKRRELSDPTGFKNIQLRAEQLDFEHALSLLRDNEELRKENRGLKARHRPASPRERATDQNLVAALLGLLLGHSPAGKPFSVFKDQAAIIEALLAHFGGLPGLSKRTLEQRFARANQVRKNGTF